MKALTLIQPWADLILSGDKTVENRTWTTQHRGPILIHAGSKGTGPEVRSAILGHVTLTDIIEDSDDHHAMDGHWHWILTDPVRYRIPISCRGHLSLWTPPVEILERVKLAIDMATRHP